MDPRSQKSNARHVEASGHNVSTDIHQESEDNVHEGGGDRPRTQALSPNPPPLEIPMADLYSPASSLEPDSIGSPTDSNLTIGDRESEYILPAIQHFNLVPTTDSNLRTTSITSSVYQYSYEGGRRYHAYKAGQYMLPNDEVEQDRLDLQHQMFKIQADKKLSMAPIPKDLHNVLDIGCGTGLWAMEFAEGYPSANVLGIDLSPIQPPEVPPNCSFRVDDVESEWVAHEKYDYIHSRAMVAAVRNWPRLFDQAFRQLKPGGYIELQDFCPPAKCDDPTSRAASDCIRLSQLCVEAGKRINLHLDSPHQWPDQLRAAGFVDIHFKWYNWPLGPWAKGQKNKIMGRWALEDFIDAVGAVGAMLTRILGWSAEETQVLIANARNELKEVRYNIYHPACFCWARKPTEGEGAEDTVMEQSTTTETLPRRASQEDEVPLA